MTKTRILITVKTYPTLSTKYDELVCTAGFRENGTWIRIYPVPFRKRSYDEQYKKYDWIELDITKNESDFRHESYRPLTINSEITVVGHLDTNRNWEERKKYVLGKIYHNMTELITEAKDKNLYTSLAVFKPSRVLDFYAEEVEREWDAAKLQSLNQLNFFEKSRDGHFKVVKKVPYKFKFRFHDNQGRESNMMIEDWETGQLYWNCLARHEGNEQKAVADVRKKYFDDFAKTKDLHFFLGTTQSYHLHSQNPFMITGTFTPTIESQGKLF